MRAELNNIDMQGEIVIGEGELDEADVIYLKNWNYERS